MPKEMEPKEIPHSVIYLWQCFLYLSGSRQAGFSGPNKIPYTEIEAWSRLNGIQLLPIEVEVIKKLDDLYVRIING